MDNKIDITKYADYAVFDGTIAKLPKEFIELMGEIPCDSEMLRRVIDNE